MTSASDQSSDLTILFQGIDQSSDIAETVFKEREYCRHTTKSHYLAFASTKGRKLSKSLLEFFKLLCLAAYSRPHDAPSCFVTQVIHHHSIHVAQLRVLANDFLRLLLSGASTLLLRLCTTGHISDFTEALSRHAVTFELQTSVCRSRGVALSIMSRRTAGFLVSTRSLLSTLAGRSFRSRFPERCS